MSLAVILLAVAAVGGLIMAVLRFSGRDLPPMGLALLHGIVAAAGLVALIVAVIGQSVSTVSMIALVGFIFAALGGFFLFSYHLRRDALPINFIVIHGLVAVISFLLLLAGAYYLRA